MRLNLARSIKKSYRAVSWVLILLAAGLLTSLTLAHEQIRTSTLVRSEPNTARIDPQPASTPTERLEVEALTLRPKGFEPSQVTRPQGRFILAVDNRTEMPDLDFRLTRARQSLAAKKMRGRELRWRQLLDLPPGDYILTESNHPQWQAQIRITPH